MFCEFLIFNVLLVLTSSKAIYNNVEDFRGTIMMNYLNKCCPMGTYVTNKICVNTTTALLWNITVYDKNIYVIEKSFEELFTLMPNKFDNITFHQNAFKPVLLGDNVYLTENGVLQVEHPNAYYRWQEIPQIDYCIDRDSSTGSVPQFWITQSDHETTTPSMLLSCFFMLLVLIVYLLLSELRNLGGKILIAYIASLLMAFSLLLVIQITEITSDVCIGLSSAIYFFILAAFCWMNVMSYDIWWTFRTILKVRSSNRRGERFKFKMYCLYAWGVPFTMTVGLVLINTFQDRMRGLPWFITPRIPVNGCFLQGGEKLLYLYVPMLILIICNWTFYIMTAYNIWWVNHETAVIDSTASGSLQAHRAQRQRLTIYLKLSIVMGLNWLLEIISFLCPDYPIWYILDAYNILIGLSMFLIFICKKKIWKKLCERYPVKKSMRWYPSSESRTTNITEFSQENIRLRSKVSFLPNGLNYDSMIRGA